MHHQSLLTSVRQSKRVLDGVLFNLCISNGVKKVLKKHVHLPCVSYLRLTPHCFVFDEPGETR